MIGRENGVAVSSRISNNQKKSTISQGASSYRFLSAIRKPVKSEMKFLEGHLTETKKPDDFPEDTAKKWKKTTNSFEMSVLKKQKQAKKEVR